MNARWLSRFAALAGGVAVLASSASVADAATTSLPAATSACSTPVFSQPFAALGDSNFYSMLPGENADSFTGAGWTLSGGASVTTTTLANGKISTVLNLPSGATAVSPVTCVASNYPIARMEVRDLVGPPGLAFAVSYLGTASATTPKVTGQAPSPPSVWNLSPPLSLQPSNTIGWQQMRVVITAGGKGDLYQLYNLDLDPRCM